MVKRAVTEARRRSARISALEERAHLQPKQNLAATSSSPPTASRKRGRKRKSLQAVVINSVTNSPHQRGEHGNAVGTLEQLENSSSPQPLPSKQTLEFVLDILQRRDTNEIFALPVNDQEVVGYYDIIKEPMDFGTMRAKLQEGMYSSLNQFERDVFLISSNAMKFNASSTVYYTEARAIAELAQRLFHSVRTAPEKFQLEYTRTRRRPGRKPQGAARDTNARAPKSSSVNDLSLRRTNQLFLGPPHSNSYNGHNNNGSTSGTRDGNNLNSSEMDRRMTYMPQALSDQQKMISNVLNAPKTLLPVPCAAPLYSDSLMNFVKGLGPTAKTVADKMLEQYRTEALNNLSSTLPPFGMAPNHFPPNLSAFLNPAHLNGGIGNQMPCNFLSKAYAASKGKMVCTDEGPNSFRQDRMPNFNDFRGLRLDTPNNGITGNNLRGEEGKKGNTVFGSPQEKTNNGSDSMGHFIAGLNQMGNTQNGHNLAPSGGYYPLTGHSGLPRPNPHPNPLPQNINKESFTWLLNHPDPPEPPSLLGGSSNGGPNTAAPAGLNQNYLGNGVQQMRWKLSNGEGPSSAAPGGLNQCHGPKPMQPLERQLPNGEGSSSAGPGALNQSHGPKPMQPFEWKLPNVEGSSSTGPGALNQNHGRKPMQPFEWKLPNGEGSSSGSPYALDQNYSGKNMQPLGRNPPNEEGPSSGYALDQNSLVKNMHAREWKLPNGEGPSSGYALDQNPLVKNMHPREWRLLNGDGSSSAPGHSLDRNSMARHMISLGYTLPGEGSSSGASFGMDQNNMGKAKQPAAWMQPNRLGLGPSIQVPPEQKFMGSSFRAAQSPGWRQLNRQGTGSSSSGAPLQQKYPEQSTQNSQPMEWKQPTPRGPPPMSNLSGLNGPVNGENRQITPLQQQSQLAPAGEVPFNTMNFLANSQGYQGQTNGQLLWNPQQSSVNGMPDLDLQL